MRAKASCDFVLIVNSTLLDLFRSSTPFSNFSFAEDNPFALIVFVIHGLNG